MPRAKYIEDIAKFLLIIEKYFTSEHSKHEAQQTVSLQPWKAWLCNHGNSDLFTCECEDITFLRKSSPGI